MSVGMNTRRRQIVLPAALMRTIGGKALLLPQTRSGDLVDNNEQPIVWVSGNGREVVLLVPQLPAAGHSKVNYGFTSLRLVQFQDDIVVVDWCAGCLRGAEGGQNAHIFSKQDHMHKHSSWAPQVTLCLRCTRFTRAWWGGRPHGALMCLREPVPRWAMSSGMALYDVAACTSRLSERALSSATGVVWTQAHAAQRAQASYSAASTLWSFQRPWAIKALPLKGGSLQTSSTYEDLLGRSHWRISRRQHLPGAIAGIHGGRP